MSRKTAKPVSRKTRSNGQGQGMNWLRPEKRLAIYLRDGLACAYCGCGVESEDCTLTLDHLRPYSSGGSNDASNLVTCCRRCNSARGNRPVRTFCRVVAQYIGHGADATLIEQRVRAAARRTIDTATAREMIARRGNFSAALRAAI